MKILRDLIHTIIPEFVGSWYIRSCRIYGINFSRGPYAIGAMFRDRQGRVTRPCQVAAAII